MGFSGISNLLSAIKFAKYSELSPDDIVLTVLTDSMDLYGSRLYEMQQEYGEYTLTEASGDCQRYLVGQSTDNLLDLSFTDRRRIHNLKYFTWVEQQGKSYDEILSQWSDRHYWLEIQNQAEAIDSLIEEFNSEVMKQ